MPEKNKKFHEFALKSSLFKGRHDWYFCYLKTERIAHVLAVLASMTPHEGLKDIAHRAASLPADIAHVAAGELEVAQSLAEIFGVLSSVRLAGTQKLLTTETCSTLVHEYEQVAERMVAGSHPSPFASVEDFFVPEVGDLAPTLDLPTPRSSGIKDIKDSTKVTDNKGQTERVKLILEHIRKEKSVSIKDISLVVRGVSEKTIQRELNELIRRGLVRRVGERRWSTYILA
jgi:hypothetical protein